MAGKLRIIGGKWRSRLLPVVDLPGLRPTTDRARETLFNWLQSEVGGAHCLDCFAGSGALGFEAASRGAASVTLLENQKKAAQVLSDNIKILNAENMQLVHCDAVNWLNATSPKKFDIVFIDPPFASDYLVQVCEQLEKSHFLSAHAGIYLEMDSKDNLPELPQNWKIVKQKKAGQVSYYLVRRNDNED